MGLQPSADATPADWYVNADVPWYVKATYGPPGLEAYARISFGREHHGEEDPGIETKILKSAIDVLGRHTTTPGRVHIGIWEGWGHSEPRGVRFSIHGRTYALLSGPIQDVFDYEAMGIDGGGPAIPHLIWPDDQTWFIAWDTDEEWNFTVAGSAWAISAVLAQPEVIGTVVPYGTPEEGWTW